MQNIFEAGSDRLLEMLARRDAEQRLLEDRQRREQLDAEARSDRERQFKLQEDQNASITADREARRLAVADAQGMELRQQHARQAAIDEYLKNPTEAGKQRLALEHNIKFEATPAKRLHNVSPGTRVIDDDGNVIYTAPDRPEKPKAPTEVKDDPALPRGSRAWIDSIAARGVPQAQAMDELSKGWSQQRSAHPNADLSRAVKYLQTLYPDGLPIASATSGQAAAPGAAAAATAAAPPKPSGPPPVMTDIDQLTGSLAKTGPVALQPNRPLREVSKPLNLDVSTMGPITTNVQSRREPPTAATPDTDLRARAIKELQTGGYLVNEETVALVMQRLKGGGE